MWFQVRTVRPLVVGGLSGLLLLFLVGCVPPPPAPAPPIIDRFAVTAADLTDPALVPVAWTVRDPNGDTLTCRLDGDGNGTWDVTVSPCRATGGRNFTSPAGSYTATLEVSDGTHVVTADASFVVGAGPTEGYDLVTQLPAAADLRVATAVAEATALWQPVFSRGVPDAAVQVDSSCLGAVPIDRVVDDIVIQFQVVPLPPGMMGQAGPCFFGPDGLPRAAVVQLADTWIDWLSANGYLTDLVVHEMGHALGFGATGQWASFTQYGTEPAKSQFTGPRSVAEWSHFGGTGTVPLSNDSSHWDETTLGDEAMTCYLENGNPHPLSSLTVAAMADLGYHVDVGAAQPWVLGEPVYRGC